MKDFTDDRRRINMSKVKKWDILFIEDEASLFDIQTNLFDHLFNKVDIVVGREATLKQLNAKTYDIVIGDLSVNPEEVGLLKQIKDMNLKHAIFALVAPKDTDKLFGIADLGLNAFELTPEQFEPALEAIADFDPYAEQA